MEMALLLSAIFFIIYKICNRANNSTDDDVLNLGGKLSKAQITVKNGMVSYCGAYSDKAMFPAKEIQSITLSPNGFGTADIIMTGNSSELGRINKIPTAWAKKALGWLTAKLQLSEKD